MEVRGVGCNNGGITDLLIISSLGTHWGLAYPKAQMGARRRQRFACMHCVPHRFAAYELESSETFELGYSHADFDGLFKAP